MTARPQPAGTGGRSAVALLAALLLAAGLVGCVSRSTAWDHIPPAVFSVDDVRPYFEGDLLVVNVSFTNRADFTPGVGRPPPYFSAYLLEWRAKEAGGDGPGRDLAALPFNFSRFGLRMLAEDSGPWLGRWIEDSAAERLGLPPGPNRVGPVLIPPNATVQLEVAFLPHHRFEGDEGFYVVHVQPSARYTTEEDPHAPTPRPSYVFTGCFNRDTDPFYGAREGGPDCVYWDHTGALTQTRVG